jgi:hypothetical protein
VSRVEGDPIWSSRAEEESCATARKSHAWAQRTTVHRDAVSSGRGRGGRPGSRASLGGGRAEAERLEEEGTRGARRWETQSSRAGKKWSAVRGVARLKEGGARGKERAEARPRLQRTRASGGFSFHVTRAASVRSATVKSCPESVCLAAASTAGQKPPRISKHLAAQILL